MHAIINGRIVLTDKVMDGCVLLFDEKITGIVSRETLDAAWQNGKKPLPVPSNSLYGVTVSLRPPVSRTIGRVP